MKKKEKLVYPLLGVALIIAVAVNSQGCSSPDKTSNQQTSEQITTEATYTLDTQTTTEFKLPQPQQTGGIPLAEAFSKRKTTRLFTGKALSDQLISNLLWSANGVNREDGKRTAPSASNCQEIDIYLFTKTAIYFYDAVANTLLLKKEGDFRTQAGKNGFFADAPVALAFVGNFDNMAKYDAEAQAFYSATDVGFVSQNVYLFCASENLSTVVCGYIDREAIQSLLEIKNGKVLLTQPVGYAE